MLDAETKRRIDSLRNILVGIIPNPQTQIDHITTALIYKFMYDMDQESLSLGGKASFFSGDYEKYSWEKLFDPKLGGADLTKLYRDAVESFNVNPNAPELFRELFKNATSPTNNPAVLKLFLKVINDFQYSHSETLGNAFEYLLSFMGSQGDAGQFRTPRHIIDFIVEIINPKKNETILDPACGTAGFLISSYKHILNNSLSATEKRSITENIHGYDITPEMVRLSKVNMYLHNFVNPNIYEYDTLTSEERWNEYYDVILANPPFMTPRGGIQPHNRFSVESNRAEILFSDYILEHLKPNGRAAIIVPEGVVSTQQKGFISLRKNLVENALIGIISLPAGVFKPYSGVKTNILLLNKEVFKKTSKIFYYEIQSDGFDLGDQRREIDKNDLPKAIIDIKNYLNTLDVTSNIALIEREEILSSTIISLNLIKYIEEQSLNSIYEYKSLGEICDLYQPKTITQNDLVEDGKYIVYGANGVIGRYNEYNHEESQVAITCRGATCGTVNFTSPYSWITGNAMVAKPKNENEISKNFLFYLLKFFDFKSVITGAAQPQITRTNLELVKIPIPPIHIQEAILNEIENYEIKIKDHTKIANDFKSKINEKVRKIWGI